MNRHRIEIEFDADVDPAHRFFVELRFQLETEDLPGIRNLETSMTPMVTAPT